MASLQSKFEALHMDDLSLSSATEVKQACELILQVEKLDGGSKSTLEALFVDGPLGDGYVPSKSGRDNLVDLGLACRAIVKGVEGYNICTQKGYWAYKIMICDEPRIETKSMTAVDNGKIFPTNYSK